MNLKPMIKKEVMFLIIIVIASFMTLSVFSHLRLRRGAKTVVEKTTDGIIKIMQKRIPSSATIISTVMSVQIKGKGKEESIKLLRKSADLFVPEKKLGNYYYIVDSNGLVVADTKNRDIEGISYRNIITKKDKDRYLRIFEKIKSGEGFVNLHSIKDHGEEIDERFVYISKIRESDFWFIIDLKVEIISLIKKPLNLRTDSDSRAFFKSIIYVNSITFILILFFSFLVIKRIIRLEESTIEKNKELANSNMLLNNEIEMRKKAEDDLKIVNKELEQLSISDGLTGIANRRRFDEILQKEWLRHARENEELSLILCDIDYFKKYNDCYGHQRGDECLKAVAEAMNLFCKRPTDLVARYGGEEFVILLPNTSVNGASSIAEKIRAAVENLNIDHSKSDVSQYVTLSLGVSSMIPPQKVSPDFIVKKADKALYKAKEIGRNRVCLES